ncbi:hypothetical protein SAMN04489835_2829 [Mycolicibacterium rutilum]|uniref:Uncharacterized protein n=1 Tax=Mycolicibacterium rutilum TaxID=370526 RepID=A0A1H6JZX9_MYCRU|nr:hypothetical protein [Mycolicibacterium rutilum]SEH68225.1 hypothetical protein SAMN04489835_2829 [Mycolicibacterium rutilum]
MSLRTVVRIASIIVVVKAVLIGAVYWRRAELIGRPVDAGSVALTVVGAVVALVVVLTAVAVAARYLANRR